MGATHNLFLHYLDLSKYDSCKLLRYSHCGSESRTLLPVASDLKRACGALRGSEMHISESRAGAMGVVL